MNYRKIVLAGGSGYVGRVLSEYYQGLAHEMVILSRHAAPSANNVRTVKWDGRTQGSWTDELNGAELLINLCGKNVNCRYTPANQAAIISSRVEPTKALGAAISGLQHPPKTWITLTSATIYRHAEDRDQDERTGDIGDGFSVDVCRRLTDAGFAFRFPDAATAIADLIHPFVI